MLLSDIANPRIKRKGPEWLIIAYEVPYQPSKFRVKVWRDLTSLGGLYTKMSFCILPYSRQAVSKAQSIKSERAIEKMLILQSSRVTQTDNDRLRKIMREHNERQYVEILEKCNEFLHDMVPKRQTNIIKEEELENLQESLDTLKQWFEKVQSLDKRRTPARERLKVKRLLNRCEKELNALGSHFRITGK